MGGITKGHRSIPLPLREQEIIVIAANYRLSPRVKAPVYIEDAAVVAWAIRNVHRFGGSSDSIFVSGHSAGGYSQVWSLWTPVFSKPMIWTRGESPGSFPSVDIPSHTLYHPQGKRDPMATGSGR